MVSDGSYTAVLDRIEDDIATLLLEVDGEDAHQLDVDPGALPEAARQPNSVLTVEVSDGDLVEATYEPDATEERRDAAQSRFDRLSERPPGDDDT